MPQRLIILGAGTALPDRDRDNTSLLWESPGGLLMIDCGGRAYQQVLRAGIDPQRLCGILLTHNHPDHISGVPALLFHLWLGNYAGHLDIYGNTSTLSMAHALCDAMELPQNGHMPPTNWHTLEEVPDLLVIENDLYSLYTTPVRHSRPTLGVKIVDRQRDQRLVYSADTRPCDELLAFAQGAHTLIHEATTAGPSAELGHTSPREAGEIAARCGVRRLIIVHYSAAYTMPEQQAIADIRAGGFTGEIHLAEELTSFDV
jgi:ribonuclease Z